MEVRLSVVICCSNDFDLVHAIDSVDEEVEIVVSITPNRLIEDYLSLRDIPYVITPLGNHAVTANAGIELANGDAVLIIDSDTALLPGAISRTINGLRKGPIVNLPITFAAGTNWLTRMVGQVRDFDNTYNQPAYKPGIAFMLSVREQLGGYWYDPRIEWSCDAELLTRIRDRRITIIHLDEPSLVHRPVPLTHAIRAYFNYGIGSSRKISILKQETHWTRSNLERRYRTAVREMQARGGLGMLAMLTLLDMSSLTGLVYDEALRRIGFRQVPSVELLTSKSAGVKAE